MKVASIEELIFPITVEAYHFLYENGLVEEKAELIEGVIYSKMPKNPIHSEILRRIHSFIKEHVDLPVFKEDPVTLNNSEPEPDIAILPPGDYSKSHPTSALLVLEVSNSSLSLDRKKAKTYAKGNIPEYVLVNLIPVNSCAYVSTVKCIIASNADVLGNISTALTMANMRC